MSREIWFGESRWVALMRALLPSLLLAAAAITATVWSIWFTTKAPRMHVILETGGVCHVVVWEHR